MHPLRNKIILLFAIAFFYSSIGHEIVLHYCITNAGVCNPGSCCSDESDCCNNKSKKENNDRCCEVSSAYLVSSDGIRETSGISIKKTAERIITPSVNAVNSPESIRPLIYIVRNENPPPEKDFLSMYHILLI